MKELTIEQKAERYDKAIKKAKEYYNKGRVPEFCNYIASDIFPELKKKTDEEMIQKLIAVCHLYYGEGVDAERDECLEWLEKQSKNKPIERKEFTSIPFGAFDSELYESMITIPDGCVATIEGNRIHIKREGKSATEPTKEEKVDNSNKIELKVGDYVVRKDGKYFHNNIKFAQITKINKDVYYFDCGTWMFIDEVKLWSISDAKNGDILASPNSKAFIYNGNFDAFNVGSYCGLDIDDDFVIADNQCNWCCNHNIKPATKEQRKSLFNEMNLLGYIWNPETKELNRLNKNEEKNNN